MPTELEFKKEFAAKRVLEITPIKAADSIFTPYGMDFHFISNIARTWEIDLEVIAFIKEIKNTLPDPETVKKQLWLDYLKASEDIKAKMQPSVLKAFGMDKPPEKDDGKSDGSLAELADMIPRVLPDEKAITPVVEEKTDG